MNSYHNPAKIDLSLVGPNHRLLTADQLDHPLPEGAEYWDGSGWSSLPLFKVVVPEVTYRIPLTLRDRIEREIGEKQDLLMIVQAVERGAEWEYRATGNQQWQDSETGWSLGDMINDGRYEFRIKPTSSSIPWTLETRPLSEVWISPKDDPTLELKIDGWNKTGAHISTANWQTFAHLHDHWLQRNGEPCGTKEGTV